MLEKKVKERSQQQCELCGATSQLQLHPVADAPSQNEDGHINICATCLEQVEATDDLNVPYLRCLNNSAWSQVPAVQVVSYRLLKKLKEEAWARDLLDMMYLDEETLAWATANESAADAVVHLDTNGNVLQAGDTVTLIKDLNVKGANFTAKRGTAVRRISLVQDNPEHIEGKVNGQSIVILTKFVKKAK